MSNDFPLAARSCLPGETFIPTQQRPAESFVPAVKRQDGANPGAKPAVPFSPPAVHPSVVRGDTLIPPAQLSDEERRLERIGEALQRYYDNVGVRGRSGPDRIAQDFAKAVCGILGVTHYSKKDVDARKPHSPSYSFALQAANRYIGTIQGQNQPNKHARHSLGAAYTLVLSMEEMLKRRASVSSTP